ncbi:MAG TPA: reverse transcriptase family protein, partial [Pirellulales bacterium]
RQLDWFADRQGRERGLPAGPLRHYHYRWVPKRAGGVRLIEIPKSRLRAIQRRVLHGILENIPPHDAAHGFRRGRSIRTFVAPHVGQRVVLRMDLQDFFMTIAAGRVCALFRITGYPEAVAALLAGLCTNSLPADAWEDEAYQLAAGHTRRQDSQRWPHLPQGAPTSPAVANLCAYRLDCRLSALAGSMEAQYTRYADDLVFSGGQDFQRAIQRFHLYIGSIALEEGFRVHARKTRIMRRSVRQQAAGVVINARPCIRRGDYDRLKATLHNCVRHGPATQNRRSVRDFKSHLAGRVSYVAMLHPARGKRLRAIFDRIAW